MKKHLLISSLLLLWLSASYGQAKISYDLGLNLCNLRGIGEKNSVFAGFNTGFSARLPMNDQFFIRPGILYSLKGYSSILIPTGSVNTRLNYISVPILAGYNATKKLSFLFGPEFSLLAGASRKIGNVKVNLDDSFEKFDVGLDLAASYQVDKRLGVELRYNMGLKNVEKYVVNFNSNGFVTENFGKNRLMQINVFYYLKK